MDERQRERLCSALVHGTSLTAQLSAQWSAYQQLVRGTPTVAQLSAHLAAPSPSVVSLLSSLLSAHPNPFRQTETPNLLSGMRRNTEVLQTSLGGMDEEEDYEDVAPKFGYEKWTSIGRS